MTPSVIAALRNIAHAQLEQADRIASIQGIDAAEELKRAWQSLLSALGEPPTSVFRERVFVPKKKKAKKGAA